ncbi:somatostatin-2-like [Salvelinus fontinalis]|uniref:somatostatin-2-like n=1 Tax=Salvelinus fontinalis TaxID=8038 RepID=UPI0024861EB0|nr:somatostatin-2-like [Salvelinus fontinalis]XP_055735267.1 somatostatin-2-like [Salvelinus fontinalis]
MKFSQIHCALALLGLALAICSQGAASQPDLDLRSRRLLQRARAASIATQEWSKRVMEDILSELSLPELEAQKSEGSTAEAKEDLERSVDNSNNLPPRERKAGCKNFYWKGFTSC